MVKIIWKGWAKSVEEAHSAGGILTGANLIPLPGRRAARSSIPPTKPSSYNHESTLDLTGVGYDGRESQEGES